MKTKKDPHNILILGANIGIAYYLTEALLEAGNSVAVLDITLDNINCLKQKYPQSLLTYLADARDEQSIQSAVSDVHRQFASIDIAIHNACLFTYESIDESSYESYLKVMDINYFGALRLAKAMLPLMREQKYGRIMFTSSGVGVTGLANVSPYASSKGAIESLAKCLDIENAKYGISAHIIHPPLTNTESASALPIPREFKADAKTVGYGLAKRLITKKFMICHSVWQYLQMKFSYRHPLFIGRLMTKATARSAAEINKT